jgi:hypothetical protein
VVSFKPRPLYLRGKSPWYPLARRLSGLQSRFGSDREKKNPQPPPGINPRTLIAQPQLYDEELHNLLSSPNIFTVNKSRGCFTGEVRNVYKLKGIDYSEDLGVDVMTILKCTLKK